jgi:hypothetical protein
MEGAGVERGVKYTFTDAEPYVVPVDGVNGGWWECHCEDAR